MQIACYVKLFQTILLKFKFKRFLKQEFKLWLTVAINCDVIVVLLKSTVML